MDCPKCGFAQPEGSTDCVRCGIVFNKWSDRTDPAEDLAPGVWVPPPAAVIAEDTFADDGTIGKPELTILGIGLIAAILAHLLPITRWAFSALTTLFHEIGHAIVAWLLGQPALPAFDFAHGGGFTHLSDFQPLLAIVIFGGFAWLAWALRSNRRSFVIIVGLALLWMGTVSAEWRRETVIASAGVLFELILAAVFFYMALSGRGWRLPEIERPLGAFAAFFVQFSTMIFAWRLGHDPDFLSWYREGKGGALMNDLEIVTLNLHIYTSLNPGIESVANFLLIVSLVPIALALLIHLKLSHVHRFARDLVTV